MVLKIAFRNVFRHKRRTLLTALTMFGGFTLCSFSVAWMDGTYNNVIDMFTRNRLGHIQIHHIEYRDRPSLYRNIAHYDAVGRVLDDTEGVAAWAPRVYAAGLASVGTRTAGVQIIGIQPDLESRASEFDSKLDRGEFLVDGDLDLVVIGQGIARKLELGLGDKLVLMAQAAETSEIQSRLMRVKGVLRTGQEDFDQILVLAALETCQEFLHLQDRVHQVAVILGDFEQSRRLATAGREALSDVEVLSWQEALPELQDFIVVDDGGNYVFHLFLFLLIGFMVLNTLLMSVLERRREFSLLDALGLSPGRRFMMVLLEAFFVALLASIAGFTLGYAGHYYLAVEGLPLDALVDMEDATIAGVVFDPVMYSYLTLERIFQSIGVVFLLTMALAVLPAFRAARRGNVQILGSQ